MGAYAPHSAPDIRPVGFARMSPVILPVLPYYLSFSARYGGVLASMIRRKTVCCQIVGQKVRSRAEQELEGDNSAYQGDDSP
jgi:hypothetical protein